MTNHEDHERVGLTSDTRALRRVSQHETDAARCEEPRAFGLLGHRRRACVGGLLAAGCIVVAAVLHPGGDTPHSRGHVHQALGLQEHGAKAAGAPRHASPEHSAKAASSPRHASPEHSAKAASSPRHASPKHAVEAASKMCSGSTEDCTSTECCKDDGLQCYQKSKDWAQCMSNCTPGIDLRGPDASPWSCKELGKRTPGDAPPPCAAAGQDCGASKCCVETGHACYEKVKGFAFCKPECVPGPDVTDPVNNHFWSCKKLGEETPGAADWVQKRCAEPGQRCKEVGCCAAANQQCYVKDADWSECKYSCKDPDQPWKGEGWACDEVGPRTPKKKQSSWENKAPVADWVADVCAKPGDNCTESQCCVREGHQCFTKGPRWSACKASCVAGPDLWDANSQPWECATLGPRTPGYATDHRLPPGATPVADWVAQDCSKDGDDCHDTRCCAKPGRQCYAKNKYWAKCMRVCNPGRHEMDSAGGEWSCEELGPRTPIPWGTPSLFCYSVIVMTGSEPSLVKFQIERSSGIAACDDFAVFSTAEPTYMGVGPQGKVTTVQFEPADITTSKDGTAGNTELFIHVWDSVRRDGRWSTLDWTVKVDPDAVLLPDRLRWHLKDHTGEPAYIVNCNKPLLPEGAMMFGALEAFSKQAMQVYYDRGQECIGGMNWKSWGEDWFMGHCLDFLGVQAVHDYGIYSDGVCTGVDCGASNAAAFHPMKDIGSWEACFNQAIGGGGDETVLRRLK